MNKPANRLGRGLNTLIAPRTSAAVTLSPVPAATNEILIREIRPNEYQPRDAFDTDKLNELADSIRASGVLQPVLVRPAPESGYQLIAGERRWRAAQIAGLETIPAIVRTVSDAEAIEFALVENLQREDLTPFERATAYQEYLDRFGATADDLAAKLGESRASVSNYLRLLKLHPEVRDFLQRGELSMGHARALLPVTDAQQQLAFARLTIRRNLSVRQVEELVRKSETEPLASAAPCNDTSTATVRHFDDLAQTLSRNLGLRVRLLPGRKKNSGRVVISFDGLDEFDRLAERLGGSVTLE